MKKKKYNYLLLELVIAFLLVGMCSLYLFKGPLSALFQEKEEFVQLDIQRLAEVGFADVRARLYSNEIKWEALDDVKLPLGKSVLEGKTYEQTALLKTKKSKKSKKGEECKKIEVKIVFREEKSAKEYSFTDLVLAVK